MQLLGVQLIMDILGVVDFHQDFLTDAQMPATMIRLNIVKGLGPVMQIAERLDTKTATRCI